METIVKILKAIFFGADDEVNTTFIQKFRQALLWIILGGGLTIGGLFYWADDEEYVDDEPDTEYYEESNDTLI